MNSLICMWMYGWHSWLMPSVHYRFTAYTRDCERSAVSMNVRLNICACLCVPVVEYVHTSCIVPPSFWSPCVFKSHRRGTKKKVILPKCTVLLLCTNTAREPYMNSSHSWICLFIYVRRQRCVVRTVRCYVFQFNTK